MSICPFDGYRVIEIGDNLYKCLFCEMPLTKKGEELVPYRNVVYPYDSVVREKLRVGSRGPPAEVVVETEPEAPFGAGLDDDMVIFIRRVAETLTPVKGYEHDEAFKRRAFKVRDQFIRELTDCFTGKRDFNKWFDSTKTSLGKHPSEMTQIMIDALEGLKNPEAVQMRNALGAALQRTPY